MMMADAEGIDPAKRLNPWLEGKAHPLWLLGHTAVVNNNLINLYSCEGESLVPEEWLEKFMPAHRGGVLPIPDPDFYPGWDEVLHQYTVIMDAAISGIYTLNDETMSGPLLGNAPPDLQERFGTVDAMLRFSAAHSAYHRGQMALANLRD